MKHYTDCQDEYDVSVLLMPTCINGLKKLAESFNATEEEYLLALGDLADCFFHYVNTDEAPKLKTPLSQIAFEFAKEQARQSANRYKTGKTNGKKGVEAKKQKADAKRAKEATKAEQAEQLNTVKPEATEVADKPKQDNQTVSNSHQLKTEKAHKPQQVQKKQQLTTQEKQKAQISKIVSKLNWNTSAGLELSDEDKRKIVEIRLNNKKIHRDQREYTQSALNLSLPQIKLSLDNGIHMKELLEAWEGNGWIKWMNAWYAKEIANDLKAQSQTAKTLKSVQASQEPVKNNDWNGLEMTDTVREMVEISYKSRMNEANKGGN